MVKVNPFEATPAQLIEHYTDECKRMFWTAKNPTPIHRKKLKEIVEYYEPVVLWVSITEYVAHCKTQNAEPNFVKWVDGLTDKNVPTETRATIEALLDLFNVNAIKERLKEIRMIIEGYENAWFARSKPPSLLAAQKELEEIKKRIL